MKTQFILLALLLSSICLSVSAQQYWLDQKIDHSSPQDSRTFQQRYWVNNTFYKPESGLAILYICGEGTCSGISQTDTFILWAQRLGAVVYALEHRYYGSSQPFGYSNETLSTENLKYLTVQNALEDLASFIKFAKDNQLGGLTQTTPWITIGGSYPGALSAWFRYKYPHLTIGAIASSAVISAIMDFKKFDEQIYISALRSGEGCALGIQNFQKELTSLLTAGQETNTQLKALFNATQLTDAEFQYYIADFLVMEIQYGKRERVCAAMVGDYKQQLEYTMNFIGLNSFAGYGAVYLRNATYEYNNNMRQWTYQTCNQLAYWNTPAENVTRAMRPLNLNLDFFRQLCQDTFGADVWADVDAFNNQFGSLDIQATNLIFTNGIEDPWQHASLLETKGEMVSFNIDCNQCAHCVDLYAPKESDSDALKLVRVQQEDYIRKWMGEHYSRFQQQQFKQQIKFLAK